jgi:hypothetical protein
MKRLQNSQLELLVKRLAKIANKYDYFLNGTINIYKFNSTILLKLRFTNIYDNSLNFDLCAYIDGENLSVYLITVAYSQDFMKRINLEFFKNGLVNNSFALITENYKNLNNLEALLIFVESLISDIGSKQLLELYKVENLQDYAKAIDNISQVDVCFNSQEFTNVIIINIEKTSSDMNKANVLEYIRTRKEFLDELYRGDYLIKYRDFSLKLLEFNKLGDGGFSGKLEVTYYWADIYHIDENKQFKSRIAKVGFDNIATLGWLCKNYLEDTDNAEAVIYKRKQIFDIKKDKDGIKVEYQAKEFNDENKLERKLTKYKGQIQRFGYSNTI